MRSEAEQVGEGEKGKAVFLQPSIACLSCHKVGETGTDIGPELSAVGSSMSTEFIIESLLWPQKDIKEGYISTTITTSDGKVIRGYIKGRENRILTIQDMSTRELIKINEDNIKEQKNAGSPMPNGLIAALSKEQFLNLVSYLKQLR